MIVIVIVKFNKLERKIEYLVLYAHLLQHRGEFVFARGGFLLEALHLGQQLIVGERVLSCRIKRNERIEKKMKK
jgi:hypothetical protein